MLGSMRRACLLVAIAASTAAAAPVRTMQSDPHPGIHLERWVDATPATRIVLVEIDLTSAEIALYATKESDKGITTSGYATRKAAQVAINGDSFAVASYTPLGLAIGDSTPWTNTADNAQRALFHLRRAGERTRAGIVPPEITVEPDELPAGTQGAFSGTLLVRAGSVETFAVCGDPVTMPCVRAPRSAIGLSADGNRLWLVTVDGWQAGSLGLTMAELAGFMQARGAAWAMALDSGSSSALVVDDAVVSSPSDGIERRVANHLAVKYGALPAGQLVGLICQNSVFSCTRISGAQVTLDDARVQTTGPDGFYDFPDVTPRLACVTVRKLGFKTKKQCQTVESGFQTYNSVVLEPGTDPPVDAGVPEDAALPDDAAPDDGGMRPDAGNPQTGDGPGCCSAGRDRPPIALLVLVGWMLARRRGTKA